LISPARIDAACDAGRGTAMISRQGVEKPAENAGAGDERYPNGAM